MIEHTQIPLEPDKVDLLLPVALHFYSEKRLSIRARNKYLHLHLGFIFIPLIEGMTRR